MARLENSPDLFGQGVGTSTRGEFTCALCGVTHNEGNDEKEAYNGDCIAVTDFAGAVICGDCFENVENEILRRMYDILSWYKRLLDRQKAERKKLEDLCESIIS